MPVPTTSLLPKTTLNRHSLSLVRVFPLKTGMWVWKKGVPPFSRPQPKENPRFDFFDFLSPFQKPKTSKRLLSIMPRVCAREATEGTRYLPLPSFLFCRIFYLVVLLCWLPAAFNRSGAIESGIGKNFA